MIKEFTLGGIKYTVKEVKTIDNGLTMGSSSIIDNQVNIAKQFKGVKVSESSKDETLHHEVIHMFLDTLGYYELSADEKLVQGMAVLMKQFEDSKK